MAEFVRQCEGEWRVIPGIAAKQDDGPAAASHDHCLHCLGGKGKYPQMDNRDTDTPRRGQQTGKVDPWTGLKQEAAQSRRARGGTHARPRVDKRVPLL